MAEVRTNLGQGLLAIGYGGGLGAITVSPAGAPRGPFPSTGVFSVEAIPAGQTAGAIYTVSSVAIAGGNQVLTLSALEFGTDVALAPGAAIVEVESARSLVALIAQGAVATVVPGGAAGSIQFNNGGVFGGVAQVPVSKGGTGTATPGLIAGANMTVSGAWPNQTLVSSGGGGGGASYKYEWIPAAINQFLTQTVVGFSLGNTSAANLNLPVSGNQLFATGLMGQSTNFLFGRRIPNEWDGSAITFDLDCIIDGGTGNVGLTGYLGPVVVGTLANPVTWGTGVGVVVAAPNIAGGFVRFSFSLDSSACVPGEFIFVAILRGVDTFAGNLYPVGGLFGIKY